MTWLRGHEVAKVRMNKLGTPTLWTLHATHAFSFCKERAKRLAALSYELVEDSDSL